LCHDLTPIKLKKRKAPSMIAVQLPQCSLNKLPLLTFACLVSSRLSVLLELAKNPIDLVSVGLTDDSNLYDWEILIMGPDGTYYEGGFFKARLVFPPDFPNLPPTMTFTSEMWHPNVYEDGRVCISILHPPGEDEFNSQESADERWRPILGVEQILVSIVSMLGDPNDESPANLDAAVMWRNDRAAFKKKVRQVVRKSQEEC
jgi:ubiquitin-conjugating enzyme E2 G1